MSNNKKSLSEGFDKPASEQHRSGRHMPIGTLVRLALEGIDSDLQLYSVRASVTTKPITHAARLELLSSEPPLPSHVLDGTHRAFIDARPVPVMGVVALKSRFSSDLGVSLRILSIVEEPEIATDYSAETTSNSPGFISPSA